MSLDWKRPSGNQSYECPNCGKRYTPLGEPKPGIDDDETTREYLFDFRSLAAMLRDDTTSRRSKSTLYRHVRNFAHGRSSGIELTKKLGVKDFSGIAGFDLAYLITGRIKRDAAGLIVENNRIARIYLHFTDVIRGQAMHYDVVLWDDNDGDPDPLAKERKRQIIRDFLIELRKAGIVPRVVTLDAEKDLSDLVYEVWGRSVFIIQCAWHKISGLDKALPTKKLAKDVAKKKKGVLVPKEQEQFAVGPEFVETKTDDQRRLERWGKGKELMVKAILSESEAGRSKLMHELAVLVGKKKDKLRDEYLGLKKELVGFPVGEKLERMGFPSVLTDIPTAETLRNLGFTAAESMRVRYNNITERQIEDVKNLWNAHHGFKSIDAARDFIKCMWYFTRTNRMGGRQSPLDGMPDVGDRDLQGLQRPVVRKPLQHLEESKSGDAITKVRSVLDPD
jgi:hypothetical protein